MDPAIREQFLQDFAAVRDLYVPGNYSDPNNRQGSVSTSYLLRPTSAPNVSSKPNSGEQYVSNMFGSVLASIIACLI
jgi:hypothetical protein